MLDLLLVEDDATILKGLKTSFPWEKEGFRLVDTATNGREAWQKLQTTPVHVVLTDINMPYVDGLELTFRVKKQFPDILVILFTGYETFEYAKEALKLGVFDFLLKPVHPNNLKKSLQSAAETIKLRIATTTRMEQSLYYLRRTLFNAIFSGGVSRDHLPAQLTDLGLSILDGAYACAIICLEDYENIEMPNADSELLSDQVQELTQTQLGGNSFIWTENGKLINTIYPIQPNDDPHQIFANILSRANETLNTSLLIFLGEPQPSLDTAHGSAEQAISLYKRFSVLKHNTIISLESNLETNVQTNDELEKDFHRFLAEGDEEACFSILNTLQQTTQTQYATHSIIKIFFQIPKVIEALKLQRVLKDCLIDLDLCLEQILQSKCTSQQFGILKEVVKGICQNILYASHIDPINKKMLVFIEEHYHDPNLSLTLLGDYMDMSPGYLCSLFKQRNHKTFSEFVLETRMQHAKHLICSTNHKIFQIAAMVGIPNVQYFCNRFKRHYEQTPTEFRSERLSPPHIPTSSNRTYIDPTPDSD